MSSLSLEEAVERRRRNAPKLKCYESLADAREAAQFFGSLRKSRDMRKSQNEGTPSGGGFVVPEVVADAIVSYREKVGVIRANAGVVNMSSDVVSIPRRSSTVTAAFVAEAATVVDQSLTFDSVTLGAQKGMALVKASSELEEDSMGFADFITAELAFALAYLEDNTAINGTGTSTYGGMTGLAVKVLGLAGAKDSSAGHNTMLEIDAADLQSILSILPTPYLPNAKWYCSQVAYAFVFARLAATAGGLTMGPDGVPRFWNLPIVISNLLPTSVGDLLDAPMLFLGDMKAACYFGSRREIRVDRSDARLMEADQVMWRATSRFDAFWELGTASVVGPILALVGN